jgi:LytS/YehU family sensor histidine kinase
MYSQLKHEKLRTAKLERDWVRARLQALRMQLNPHFLFNTLNAVVALVHERPHAAERMLVGLGELLRRALREGEAEQVTLEHEAEFVRKYLEMQRLRFADRLVFEIDIPPAIRRALVPGLLLQPLAENAVIHGVANDTDVVRISVRGRREGEKLVLEVHNTAAPQRVATSGSGIGLGATRERLRAMFGAQQDVELGTEAGEVVARVRIPFALAADAAEAA